MSSSELDKATTNVQNENADSYSIKQENPIHVIDKDSVKSESVTQEALNLTKSKDLQCIDIKGNSIESPVDSKYEETAAGKLVNIAEFKSHYTVDFEKPPGLMRQICRQEQPPQQPQRSICTVSLQYGPTQFQYQAGFPQSHGYPKAQGYPQSQEYPQSQGYPQAPGYPRNPEAGYDDSEEAGYTPNRNSFVLKVFFFTFVCLGITAGYTVFVYEDDTARSVFESPIGKILAGGASIVMTVIFYAHCLCPVFLGTPWIQIALVLSVICLSQITAIATVFLDTEIIMLALLATAVTCLVCMCLACTRIDFTKCWFFAFVAGIVLFVLSILLVILAMVFDISLDILSLILLILGTLLQVLGMIMKLQSILGGRSVELEANEYSLGTFMLYTATVYLFLRILRLIIRIRQMMHEE